MDKLMVKFDNLVDKRDFHIIENYLRDKDVLLDETRDISDIDKEAFLCKAITLEEFNSALASIKIISTPCPDFISFKMIKNLPKNALMFLLDIFNMIIDTNVIPTAWRQY